MLADYSVLRFNEQGLIPAIVQDVATGRVLMLAYMNREALERTLATRPCPLLEPLAGTALAEG